MRFILLFAILVPNFAMGQSQNFYFGNDLSYVNQMEDCGAVYKESNQPKDPFTIFSDHGTNLVRVRLWKDPSWWQDPIDQPEGVKPHYNDLEDVKKTISRAKENGMQVMLGIHYSDFWADPGRQLIPRSWLGVAHDLEALKDSVYNYTVQVLTELDDEGLMPDIVKVGNENNRGFLMDIAEEGEYETSETVSTSWSRHAQLFNAAIKAVRDVGATASINPKISLHMSLALNTQVWNYQNYFINNGVTDFDIIGFSYYYSWHGGSIAELQNTVSSLVNTFPGYEVMCVETGYPWSNINYDALPNIVDIPDPDYLPLTPEKQLEYLIDFTRAVMKGGGVGVVFWEPAWVSTPCRTPWGVGSSHDHLAFFDPSNTNFMENGGGRWTEHHWYEDISDVKVTFKVDMFGQDISQGVFMKSNLSPDPIQLKDEQNNIFYHYTYLPKDQSGSYYFLNGPDDSYMEEVPAQCGENAQRTYVVPAQDVVFDYQWSSCEPSNPDRQFYHKVTFKVDISGHDSGNGAYITGSFTGDPWKIVPMENEGNGIYSYSIAMKEGRSGAFHFLTSSDEADREIVPIECAAWWNTDRGYEVKNRDVEYFYAFGSCDQNVILSAGSSEATIYPNPASDEMHLIFSETALSLQIFDLAGSLVAQESLPNIRKYQYAIPQNLKSGVYLLKVQYQNSTSSSKLLITRQ